jgi:hypothetical protein
MLTFHHYFFWEGTVFGCGRVLLRTKTHVHMIKTAQVVYIGAGYPLVG